MNRLTIHNGPHEGRRFSIRNEDLSVGKGGDCRVRLEDSEVADHHFDLISKDDLVYVKMAGSTLGVLVNGTSVDESRALQHGDELQVGGTRLMFSNAALHAGMQVRRIGKMQFVTVVSIIAVLVLEGLFLIGFSMFRGDRASLELLRKEELERKSEDLTRSEIAVAPVEISPGIAIQNLDLEFHRDDQNIFDICLIDLSFTSQRGLRSEEIDLLRIEGEVLEKVGTNQWTESAGWAPNEVWPFSDESGNQSEFRSRVTLLLPHGLADDGVVTNAVLDEVLISGAVKIYLRDELQAEKKMEFTLPDEVRRPQSESDS